MLSLKAYLRNKYCKVKIKILAILSVKKMLNSRFLTFLNLLLLRKNKRSEERRVG